MNGRNWEIAASAALDGELGAEEARALLDAMATDPACRAHWRDLRRFQETLDPLVHPATTALGAERRRLASAWWLAPVAAAALFAVLFFSPASTPIRSLPGPDGDPVRVRLAEAEGEMTDTRFVELVVELLRADLRYQEKMREVLEEVRPATPPDEGSAHEDTAGHGERMATATENPARPDGVLPYEATTGIH